MVYVIFETSCPSRAEPRVLGGRFGRSEGVEQQDEQQEEQQYLGDQQQEELPRRRRWAQRLQRKT